MFFRSLFSLSPSTYVYPSCTSLYANCGPTSSYMHIPRRPTVAQSVRVRTGVRSKRPAGAYNSSRNPPVYQVNNPCTLHPSFIEKVNAPKGLLQQTRPSAVPRRRREMVAPKIEKVQDAWPASQWSVCNTRVPCTPTLCIYIPGII